MRTLALVLALPLTSACIFVESTRVQQRGTTDCNAEILLAAPSAERYESIAAISVYSGYAVPKEQLLQRIRVEACSYGADAAYIQSQTFGSCATLMPHQVSAVALKRR